MRQGQPLWHSSLTSTSSSDSSSTDVVSTNSVSSADVMSGATPPQNNGVLINFLVRSLISNNASRDGVINEADEIDQPSEPLIVPGTSKFFHIL